MPSKHQLLTGANVALFRQTATAIGPDAHYCRKDCSMKKMTLVLAATGLLALSACNKTPEAQNVIDTGDNVAAALDNTADNLEATADNATGMAANTIENAADATKNAADTVKDQASNMASNMSAATTNKM